MLHSGKSRESVGDLRIECCGGPNIVFAAASIAVSPLAEAPYIESASRFGVAIEAGGTVSDR